MSRQINRKLFASDIHVPFHDKLSVKTVRNYNEKDKPKVVFFGGDICDFYSISKFDKDPARKFSLQEELDETVDLLADFIRVNPDARYIFLEGNHENRTESYASRHPEMASLRAFTVPKMLQLDELGIEFVPYDKGITLDNIVYKHGMSATMHAAKKELETEMMDGVSGHIHRIQRYSLTNRQGSFTWYTNGHLTKQEDVEYMNQQTPNWQQGIIIVDTDSKGNNQVHQIAIRDHKFYFDGVLYSPRMKL